MADRSPDTHITEDMVEAGARAAAIGEGRIGTPRRYHLDLARTVLEGALAGYTVTPHTCDRCGETVGYMLCDPCEAEAARQAGRLVVEVPEPKGWRNRMTGDMHIWPIGGWSVTAEPGRVSISQSTDGLGGGLGFEPGQAREFGPALIAAAELADRLAARSVSPKGDNTNG